MHPEIDFTGDAPSASQDPQTPPPNAQELAFTLKVLGWLAENPTECDDMTDLGRAIARAYKRVRKQRRIDAAVEARVREDRPDPREVRACYICRSLYREVDAHYPLLCPECSARNREHRTCRVDLTGRRAIVTGGRIKLGYQTVLKLLRDGAEVIATTRFPKDAAGRYRKEPDFSQWKDRLTLHALDFRDFRAVQRFADDAANTFDGLDILINNAAQTIRREPDFYRRLLANESHLRTALPNEHQPLIANFAEPRNGQFARHEDDQFPQLSLNVPATVEAAVRSTWSLAMEEVAPIELAEVMVINAMAPFVLCSRLEPLLRRSRFADRYVVNVTSIEGQFERENKSAEHPHTNMAKAALNMLTRTAAKRCAENGIYMNSVDPGWITHMNAMNPADEDEDANHSRAAGAFVPPLDAVDGAARIYDPIVRGIQGAPVSGLLLKDFMPVPW